jgi:hypothetical protein
MQTFSDIIKSRAQPVEKKGRFKVQKVDEDKRLVFGWANVSVDVGGNEVVDLQEDMIDPETLEAAAYKFAELYRDGGEMHERTGTAVMVEGEKHDFRNFFTGTDDRIYFHGTVYRGH